MKRLIASLAIILAWAGLAAAQTVLPIRFGANGVPLTPLQQVSYFGWLAPHASLPSELTCAQEIGLTSEGIPSNVPMNSVIPTSTEITNFYANPNSNAGVVLPPADYQGITGDYPVLLSVTPSTDMLIRWAACKWGIDEDTLRAQFWEESQWRNDAAGDVGTTQGACTAPGLSPSIYNTTIAFLNTSEIINQGQCWQSYGIGQEKVIFFSTEYPTLTQSTAFAVDVRAASERGCINGDQVPYFQSNGTCTATGGHQNCNVATGTDLEYGCVISHFSGSWWDQNAINNYYTPIINFIAHPPWPGGR